VQRVRSRGADLPVAALGLGLALVFAGVLTFTAGAAAAGPDTWLAIRWFGVSFAVTGAWLALSSSLALRRRGRVLERGRGQPWLFDHRWSERATTDEPYRRIGAVLRGMLLFALFLLPLHLLVMEMAEAPRWGFGAMLLLCDLFVLAGVGYALLLLTRVLRHGRRHVTFETFPFRTGDRLFLAFRGGRALRGRDLDARLQCVREVRPKFTQGGTGFVVHELLHEQRALVTADDTGAAVLAFDVPPDLPGNDLAGVPAIYWELHVTARSYDGIFLLPVYDRVKLRVA